MIFKKALLPFVIFPKFFQIIRYEMPSPMVDFQPEKFANFCNLLILAKFEILTSDLETRPKIRVLPIGVCPGCAVPEIYAIEK